MCSIVFLLPTLVLALVYMGKVEGYDPKGLDRDCADFENQASAQRFFIAAGGPEKDPHRLDRNRDGTACESLLLDKPVIKLVAGYDPHGEDRDCADFDTQADAQRFFIAAGGPEKDPHQIDRNRDGTACESLLLDKLAIKLVAGYDPHGEDRDCADFDTQADAQRFFIAAGGPEKDPHQIEGDKDGIACESLLFDKGHQSR